MTSGWVIGLLLEDACESGAGEPHPPVDSDSTTIRDREFRWGLLRPSTRFVRAKFPWRDNVQRTPDVALRLDDRTDPGRQRQVRVIGQPLGRLGAMTSNVLTPMIAASME